MSVDADSPTTTDLTLGGEWVLSATVHDADGRSQPSAVVTAVITQPNDVDVEPAPDVDDLGAGAFRVVQYPDQPGRWTGYLAAAGLGRCYFAAYVSAPASPPTVVDLLGPDDTDDGYLGPCSWSQGDVQEALDEEAAAQRAVCRVPAAYPPDLRGALMRRVAVNLARRPLALGMTQADAETGTAAYLPGSDPEVRRLEGPWRKLTIG